MAYRAHSSAASATSRPAGTGAYIGHPQAADVWSLSAEDRLAPPPRRRAALLTPALLALLAVGGAMAILDDRVWSVLQLDRLLMAPAGKATPQPAAAAPPHVAELTTRTLADTTEPAGQPLSVADGGAAADGQAPASKEGEAEVAAPPTPLPPPPLDASDPLQVRAAAAGLHPEISRALLERLSAEDFRNAAVAIGTALAETPDAAAYLWPSQRKPEQALFRVHFVAGAPERCRRYVVTVTKDRWSTTALPMERCGMPAPSRAGK